MPTMSDTISVAANSTSINVIGGRVFEFMRRPGVASFLATTTAVGVKSNINIGGEQVADGALVPQSNRYPIVPDDRVAVSGARQGERIFQTFQNTTGGALIVTWLVEIAET